MTVSEGLDLSTWLERHGLGACAEVLRAHDIDLDILPDLSDGDLAGIGLSLGMRRRLMKAAAGLRETAGETPPASPAAPGPASASPAAAGAGERRHLTVMFCDLVDSTGMAARLDPEDWHELVAAYQKGVAEAVTRFGGHVAKNLGDGALVYFGYPQAQENDAERAVRAGLAIQDSLAALNRRLGEEGKPPLAARVGLHAGAVVLAEDADVFGEVPNIAARVQTAAQPGWVLISPTVQRSVAGLFVVEDQGAQRLKGVPEPMVLYRVVRASGRRGRLHAVAGNKPTPLVGRDEELRQILARWDRARAGEGQMVLVVGEGGLGKSRLAEEFRTRLADMPHTWIETGCGQLLQNTPFHPFAAFFAERFGGRDEAPERRLSTLEDSLLALGLVIEEAVPLLAPLLDLPLPDRYLPSTAPADEQRRRLVALIATWFIASAKSQPLVLAFEDLHWADASTLEVLKLLADQGAAAAVMLLMTARPEFRPPWAPRPHHLTLTLSPLGAAEVACIVAEIAARHALPRDTVDAVVARTGGVPLFVEEVARLLLETGERASSQAIPSTLAASLTARLDRLGSAREVAQLAAVIGGAFNYRLIRSVAGLDETILATALERLTEADILQPQGVAPQSVYRFRHALMRDAAYETLLKSRRRELHRLLADALTADFKDMIAARPELLAHHLTEAGDTTTAMGIWRRAGDEAMARAAFAEGAAHYSRAIEILETLPDADQRLGESFHLRTKRAECYVVSKGHSAPETRAAFEDALNVGERVGEPVVLATVLAGLVSAAALRAEYATAQAYADRLLALAQRSGGAFERGWAHFRQGHIQFYQGDLRAARRSLETGYAIGASEPLTIGGTRLSGAIMVLLPLAKTLMGELDQGRALAAQSVTEAEAEGIPHNLAYAKLGAISPHIVVGDPAAAEPLARSLVALCTEHKLLVFHAFASVYFGWALRGIGQAAEGLEHAQHGVDTLAAVGTRGLSNWFRALLAETQFDAGQEDAALAGIEETVKMDALSPFGTPFALRAKGSLLLRRAAKLKGDAATQMVAQAEEALRQAVQAAHRQGNLLIQLEAANTLARQFKTRHDLASVRGVLEPVYGRFSEGLDTLPLREARELLEGL
jgi:class 3 adenylate cyclase/tetratricopeptide (TPR) repeat protein